MGVPASNKPIGYNYAHVYWKSEDGSKIKKVIAVSNAGIIAAQLGLTETPAPAPPTPAATPDYAEGEGDDTRLDAWNAFYQDWHEGSGVNQALQDAFADDIVVRRHHMGSETTEKSVAVAGIHSGIVALTGGSSAMELHAVGNFVVGFGTHTAKHTGDIGAMKATNAGLTWHEVFVAKYREGKIVELDQYLNPAEML